jgi:hypothetical protein
VPENKKVDWPDFIFSLYVLLKQHKNTCVPSNSTIKGITKKNMGEILFMIVEEGREKMVA